MTRWAGGFGGLWQEGTPSRGQPATKRGRGDWGGPGLVRRPKVGQRKVVRQVPNFDEAGLTSRRTPAEGPPAASRRAGNQARPGGRSRLPPTSPYKYLVKAPRALLPRSPVRGFLCRCRRRARSTTRCLRSSRSSRPPISTRRWSSWVSTRRRATKWSGPARRPRCARSLPLRTLPQRPALTAVSCARRVPRVRQHGTGQGREVEARVGALDGIHRRQGCASKGAWEEGEGGQEDGGSDDGGAGRHLHRRPNGRPLFLPAGTGSGQLLVQGRRRGVPAGGCRRHRCCCCRCNCCCCCCCPPTCCCCCCCPPTCCCLPPSAAATAATAAAACLLPPAPRAAAVFPELHTLRRATVLPCYYRRL